VRRRRLVLGTVALVLVVGAVGFAFRGGETEEVAPQAYVSEDAMTQAAEQAAAAAQAGAEAIDEVEQRAWGLGDAMDLVPPRSALRQAGGDQPLVALTFDDGPSPYTADVLSILDRYDVKATFFVLGQNLKNDERVIRQAAANGHVIANHTWTHSPMPDMGPDQLLEELKGTSDEIARLSGRRPNLQRPPYGDFDTRTNRANRKQGMLTVAWNVDSLDWRSNDADAIVRAVLDAPALGNGAIILLHDGGGDRSSTVAALPRILDGLAARGLKPVTLPELLRAAPPDPAREGTLVDSSR